MYFIKISFAKLDCWVKWQNRNRLHPKWLGEWVKDKQGHRGASALNIVVVPFERQELTEFLARLTGHRRRCRRSVGREAGAYTGGVMPFSSIQYPPCVERNRG